MEYDTESVKKKKEGYCVCQCVCGNIKKARAADLRRQGNTASCGCMTRGLQSKNQHKDYTGQKFNHLLIEEMIYEIGKPTKCKCLCDCGNVTIVNRGAVVSGHTKSCGCAHDGIGEILSKDWTGVVSETGVEFLKKSRVKDYKWWWICKCGRCGSEFEALPYFVNNGETVACKKCTKSISNGEIILKRVLDDLNITYEQQYAFEDCKSKKRLRFDFAVISQTSEVKILIEYDGIQHYKPVDFFGGEEEFSKTKERDEIKNKYCKENNIPLIRIPYSYSYKETYNILSNIL